MWFPKPSLPADIRIAGVGGALNRDRMFDLLSDPSAVEWRDKVGVTGPLDGSAKATSRLIASSGWVLKTNIALAARAAEDIASRIRVAMEMSGRVRLWHPDKTWAVYRAGDSWYSLSATPELRTVRRIVGFANKVRGWTTMCELAVEIAQTAGIGLDLNPSNFGDLPNDARLYYLDDEWYPQLTFAELASASVARIPEEPEAEEREWWSWGQVLGGVLQPLCPSSSSRRELLDSVSEHPITAQFASKRAALCDGLRLAMFPERTQRKSRAASELNDDRLQRTAVIADVHGNVVALDAVLSECARLGVDSYIFAGDAVGYGPNPRECVQRLAELPNAHVVRGNHDHAIGIGVFKEGMNRQARSCANWTHDQLSREEREWLVSLPLDARGANWLAVHGAPKDPHRFLAYVYELTYQDNLEHMARNHISLCFCGHTHVQFIHEKTAAGEHRKLGCPEHTDVGDHRILIVNPGSVGQPRDHDSRAAFAVWDRLRNSIFLHRVSYSVQPVAESLHRLGFVNLAERLLQGT